MFDESDPKAQAINMAWSAARTRYPEMGAVSDYNIEAPGSPDDLVTVYFYLAGADEPIPTIIVNVRNGQIAEIFREETTTGSNASVDPHSLSKTRAILMTCRKDAPHESLSHESRRLQSS